GGRPPVRISPAARGLGASHGLPDIVAIRTPPRPFTGRGALQGDLPARIMPSTCASMFPPDTTATTLARPARPVSAAATDAAPAPSATTPRDASSRTASAT